MLSQEFSAPVIEQNTSSEEYKEWMCVVKSIDSMASQIAGKTVKMDQKMQDLRTEQMGKSFAMVIEKTMSIEQKYPGLKSVFQFLKKRADLNKLETAVKRLDQISIKELIAQIQNTDTEIGQVLKGCDFEYKSGGLKDAVAYAKQGYAVGVTTQFPMAHSHKLVSHFFHLAVSKDDSVYDMSTFSEPFLFRQNAADNYSRWIDQQRKMVGSWNMLLMKQKPASLPKFNSPNNKIIS